MDRTTISVATLNVGGRPRGLPPLSARAPVFGRWFADRQVDVINFQEVWTSRRLAVLRAALPSYRHVAWRRGVGGQPAGGLVTFSRLPVAGVSYTAFRGVRAEGGGTFFQWQLAVNSRLQGVLIVATATRTGEAVTVANTHLTANRDGDWSPGNRYRSFQRDQLDALHRALAGIDTGVALLTGDFNIASGSGHELVRTGWSDPFAGADRPTFHAEFLPPGRRERRIDYLLVRGAPALAATVLFAEAAQVGGGTALLSDHCGLLARLGVS